MNRNFIATVKRPETVGEKTQISRRALVVQETTTVKELFDWLYGTKDGEQDYLMASHWSSYPIMLQQDEATKEQVKHPFF